MWCFALINTVLVNLYVFGSCFRTLPVIPVSDFFFFPLDIARDRQTDGRTETDRQTDIQTDRYGDCSIPSHPPKKEKRKKDSTTPTNVIFEKRREFDSCGRPRFYTDGSSQRYAMQWLTKCSQSTYKGVNQSSKDVKQTQ